jgi:hypothetical protein
MGASMKTPPPRPAPAAPRAAVETKGEGAKLGKLTRGKIAPRIVLNAVEGWGKTTFAAHAPKPAMLMSRGETGYETLLSANVCSVPSVDAARINSWAELLDTLSAIANNPASEYETIVLDALSGYERLCHEHVCARDFGGDWGEKGFGAFQKGYDLATNDWDRLLQRLDEINAKGVAILILAHSKIQNFKNPIGPDFDRYVIDAHHKTWGVTHKWADAVLFGRFRTVLDKVDNKGVKGKGIGGTDRILHCQQSDAWVAKNRYGMPIDIDIPDNPTETYSHIMSYITGVAN